MAKIVITTDTETKELMVSIDGTTIEANSVNVCKHLECNCEGEEGIYYSLWVVQNEKDSDLTKITSYNYSDFEEIEKESYSSEATLANGLKTRVFNGIYNVAFKLERKGASLSRLISSYLRK